VVVWYFVLGEVEVLQFAGGEGEVEGQCDVVPGEVQRVQGGGNPAYVCVLAQIDYFQGGVAAVLEQAVLGLDLDVAQLKGTQGGAGLYEGDQTVIAGEGVPVFELGGREGDAFYD
jgi:hypothetical protein